MRAERDMERSVMAYLRGQGWEVYKSECIQEGFPDLMALKDGAHLLIELKALGGSYRPAQIKWHREHAQWENVYRIEEVDEGFKVINSNTDWTFSTLWDALEWIE